MIAADGRASHAQVVRVIDLLRRENVTKFAINVDPEDLGGARGGPPAVNNVTAMRTTTRVGVWTALIAASASLHLAAFGLTDGPPRRLRRQAEATRQPGRDDRRPAATARGHAGAGPVTRRPPDRPGGAGGPGEPAGRGPTRRPRPPSPRRPPTSPAPR